VERIESKCLDLVPQQSPIILAPHTTLLFVQFLNS